MAREGAEPIRTLSALPAPSEIAGNFQGRGPAADGQWAMSHALVARAVLFGAVVCGCGGGSAGVDPGPLGGWRPPQILSFSPNAGPVGAAVLLEGLSFAEKPAQNTVRFN